MPPKRSSQGPPEHSSGECSSHMAFSPLDPGQGDGWHGAPLGYKKHLGMFLVPTEPKSQSCALQDPFNHRIRNYTSHSGLGSNSISKCSFFMKSSYISGKTHIDLSSLLFTIYGSEFWASVNEYADFSLLKGILGVVEIANFEKLATQDTLWVSSSLFFF